MSNIDDMLIITIVIQTHGKVITYELDNTTAKIFENVLMLCKAGGFVDNYSTAADELMLVGALSNYFRKDIETTTYDIISQSKKGIVIGNITFDKELSIYEDETSMFKMFDPISYIKGIYLLSIHQGKKFIYPKNPNEKVINFMNVNDLSRFAQIFNKRAPNISDMSTPLSLQKKNKKKYIDEKNMIENNKAIPENEKEVRIEQIRRQFYNYISQWQLTLNNNNITTIKLSALIKLIKQIIDQPCFITLLDYSCNSPANYIPEEQNSSAKYMVPDDIEQGNKKFGGIKRYSGNKYKKGTRKKGKKCKKRTISKKVKTRRR